MYIPSEPTANASIALCEPHLHPAAWDYVKRCLDSGWVSSAGEYVDRFERLLADYVGTRHAVATVNGTSALHLALLVAGVRPDDEVLVSALTFIAPANAVRYANAWPVFIDADPSSGQMNPQQVIAFLQHECVEKNGGLYNRTTGRRVRAILPVHVLGHPVDMSPILDVASNYQLPVIEDATESLGALYRGRLVGHLGDIACFSFNGNKLITTGGGGMILTDNEEWARRARYLSTQAKDDPLEYVHGTVGYNYRLTNLQAALGCSQMEHLDEHIEAKRRIAARYSRALAGVRGIETMREADWARSVFWMYTIRVNESEYGFDSRRLLHHLAAVGIQSRPLWAALHRSTAFASLPPRNCPVAEFLVRKSLSLPCSVGLTERDQDRVIAALAGRFAEEAA